MRDLLVLVPDKNMQFAISAALQRPQALGIRVVDSEILVHVGRDGGVRTTGPALVAIQRKTFNHALLCLDFEGSGTKHLDAISLENELDAALAAIWSDRGKSIVIDPELEQWMWGSDTAIKETIDWPADEGLREWLAARGHTIDANKKPTRPKEALELVFQFAGTPRSSANYHAIARRISLLRCKDPSFQRLRLQLQNWFSRA